MPPSTPPPFDLKDHLLPPAHPPASSSAGPIVGIIIILALLILGALYFWGAHLNQQDADQLPFIPGDTSTEGY